MTALLRPPFVYDPEVARSLRLSWEAVRDLLGRRYEDASDDDAILAAMRAETRTDPDLAWLASVTADDVTRSPGGWYVHAPEEEGTDGEENE